MWSTVIILAAFYAHFIIAEELQNGNHLLNIEDGILRSIKATGDSWHIDLSGLNLKQLEERVLPWFIRSEKFEYQQ